MSQLLSPISPELDEAHFTLLAHYAKNLGRVSKPTRFSLRSGERRSQHKGHGMEMQELRPYQISDEFKHIDWRVTARTGKVHTRIYAQEHEHERTLLMDLSNSAYFGTRYTFISTRLIQLAGIIAWRSEQNGDQLNYHLTFGSQYYENNRKSILPDLLNQLRKASLLSNRKPPTDATPFLSKALSHTHNKDVIILTDRQNFSKNEELSLKQLSKHNQVYWIQIIDQNTFNMPAGHYRLADDSGVHAIQVTQKSLQEARQDLLKCTDTLRQKLYSVGIHYQLFDLSESPEKIARYLLDLGALR